MDWWKHERWLSLAGVLAVAALFAVALVMAGCSYKYQLDNQGLDELRAQQSTMAEAISNLQKRQDENDAKIRVMWTHGITK